MSLRLGAQSPLPEVHRVLSSNYYFIQADENPLPISVGKPGCRLASINTRNNLDPAVRAACIVVWHMSGSLIVPGYTSILTRKHHQDREPCLNSRAAYVSSEFLFRFVKYRITYLCQLPHAKATLSCYVTIQVLVENYITPTWISPRMTHFLFSFLSFHHRLGRICSPLCSWGFGANKRWLVKKGSRYAFLLGGLIPSIDVYWGTFFRKAALNLLAKGQNYLVLHTANPAKGIKKSPWYISQLNLSFIKRKIG